jgi:hypothetical protein
MSPDDPQGAPSATLHENRGLDPALEALIQLLESERNEAVEDRPALVSKADPGQLWLLWFAIGATREVCVVLGREADDARNELFRKVADRVFPAGIRSACDPIRADRRLIDLFESAGAAAVQACIRGDERLGYYLAGLRVSADRGTPPLLN